MYISKETIITILLIVFFIFHMILHIIEFIKIHNLKVAHSSITWDKIKNKAKELFTTLIKPHNSIITGFKEFIFNCIHTQTDDKDETSEGENG